MARDLEAVSCVAYVPIFKNLSEEELSRIIDIATHKKLNKGDFVYQTGDRLNDIYVIHKGKVKIVRYSPDGKEQVIRILSSGDFLGELSLFNNAEMTTYAETVEPSVICLVNNDSLKDLMNESPLLTFKMMSEVSQRLVKAETLIEHSNLRTSIAKLSNFLLTHELNNEVILQTTKVNIASNLGISAETFSRKLKELKEMGAIKTPTNKKIIITNYELLEQIAYE